MIIWLFYDTVTTDEVMCHQIIYYDCEWWKGRDV